MKYPVNINPLDLMRKYTGNCAQNAHMNVLMLVSSSSSPAGEEAEGVQRRCL